MKKRKQKIEIATWSSHGLSSSEFIWDIKPRSTRTWSELGEHVSGKSLLVLALLGWWMLLEICWEIVFLRTYSLQNLDEMSMIQQEFQLYLKALKAFPDKLKFESITYTCSANKQTNTKWCTICWSKLLALTNIHCAFRYIACICNEISCDSFYLYLWNSVPPLVSVALLVYFKFSDK